MGQNLPAQSYTPNCLLSAMTPNDYMLIAPHLERVELDNQAVLLEPHALIEHVHFLESGVGSVIATQDDDPIEVGLFCREGLSGMPVLLGVDRAPARIVVQVGPAAALRIATDNLREACLESSSLHQLLLRYVQSMIVQSAQTAAVNAHQHLPQRLARWLLMCHDRVDGDEIALTHGYMAIMLGVRRAGVTVTLHALEATTAIRASRGLVLIRDRVRLEEIAGDTYGAPEAEYRRLIGPFGR